MYKLIYRFVFTLPLLVWLTLSGCQLRQEGNKVEEQAWHLDSIVKVDTFSHLQQGADSAMTSFLFKYLYYTGADSLTRLINKHFLGSELANLSPQELVERYYELHKAYWQNPNFDRAMDEETEYNPSPWVYDLTLHQEQDMGHILSFSLTEASYRQGTQPYEYVSLASFDLNSLSKIQESDIFIEGYQEGLAEVIQMKIMQEHKVHKTEDLSNEGFFSPKEISPNGNFMLTTSGLRYSYAPQEIAPYTWGNIYVDLTWDDISHLIRPASIVEEYI